MAFPDPSNVSPWYLRNITQALALDETSGNVYLRTDAQIGTINIAGNVNIPGNINARVYELGNVNISGNTLPVSGTVTALQGNIPWIISNTNVTITSGNVGITGNIAGITGNIGGITNPVTVNQGTTPWVVTGNTNVAITSGNVGIIGNIAGITALPPITGNVGILGNVNVNPITGNVDVTGNVGILGNVNVNPITGNVNATVTGNVGILGNVNVNPITGNVSVTGNVNANVTGNVNANVTGNVGILGNVNVTQGTTPWVISNTNVTITSGNVGILGNVNVNPITGNVSITGNVGILGNVNVNPITGNVSVTGNVNANVTGNVGILGNVNVTQGTDPWIISGNVTANIASGNITTVIGGTNLDAFGRLRVSNPFTLFDSQNLYVDGGQFSNITATGGNITYVANESSFNLSVTAANGSSVVTQSKTTQPYQPGKSLLSMNSFAFAALTAGCRQRVGYFTATNGVYFEAAGEDLFLVIRSSASGSLQEERIAQSVWNGDRLNGLGGTNNPTGIELDPALVNIFWCDIEWLGVGNVRVGFIINGVFIVCHTFQHANQAGNTRVYMTSATLNPRYEITNTADTAGARTMKQICSTVISEGGYSPSPTINYVVSGITPTRVDTGNVYTNLATIRLNPAYPDAVVTPAQVDLLLTDVRYGVFQLVTGASNAAGLTYANVNGGVVQANTSPVQITDGTVVYAGVTSSRDTFAVSEDVSRRLQLARHANGTPITLTLCVGYGSNNTDLIWKFGWAEVTS